MILKSIELSVYPNKKGIGLDGKVYYNALDIKALKNDDDVLGINNNIIEDACFITHMIDKSFSNNGIVLYDKSIDLFSYILVDNNDNQLLVGLKEISVEKLINLLNDLIKIIGEKSLNVSFYLTINGKVNIICNDKGEKIEYPDYEKILVQLNSFVPKEIDIVLPRRGDKIQSNKSMEAVIEQLKAKIREKEAILADLNKQIVEIESLIEENEFLDRQILDSKKRITDISNMTDDNLL